MPEQNNRLYYLLEQYSAGVCSNDELQELGLLVNKTGDAEMHAQLDRLFEQLAAINPPEGYSLDDMYRTIMQTGATARIRFLWLRYVAAASVLLLLGISSYFFFFSHTSRIINPKSEIIVHDVKAPAANRATITLANGQKIFLDSVSNGTLATQNNISIIKTGDGKLVYEGSKAPSPKGEGVGGEAFNTLNNPRGSKVIDMILSDGSHVWLDAGSSLTYPVAFVGNARMGSYGERKVSITGQAYFEVKHNEKMPFTVSANGVEIHDIGTAFNVNAYDDEDAIRVTLLEGSVKVSSPSPLERDGVRLKPGEQAIVADHSRLTIDHSPDLNQVMAWKNGKFDFGASTDIKSIMRQIARWYNVEIQYKDNVQESFAGGISREVNVSEVLKNFELTGRVHFSIESNKIIVKK